MDNTAAIQAKLDTGATTLDPGQEYNVTGLTVYYDFDLNGSTINFTPNSGTCLNTGASNIKISNGTLLGMWDFNTPYDPAGSNGINSTGDNVTLDGIIISQFSNYGITQNGNAPIVTNCNLNKIGYIPYLFNSGESDTRGGVFAFNQVDRSMLSNPTQPGVAIRGSGTGEQLAAAWLIHDCNIAMPDNPADITAECLEIRHLSHIWVYNNSFVGGSMGLSIVTGADFCTHFNNIYSGQSVQAIEIGASYNTGYDNTIMNCLGIGVLYDGVSEFCSLENTHIANCGKNSIQTGSGTTQLELKEILIDITEAATSGIYLAKTQGVTLIDVDITGTGEPSTNGLFFDQSPGQLTMIRGSINGVSNKINVYAPVVDPPIITDNLLFVNVEPGLTVSDVFLNTGGQLGTNVQFVNQAPPPFQSNFFTAYGTFKIDSNNILTARLTAIPLTDETTV